MESSWWTRPDQLDDDQKEVVALPLSGSHLVTGPPGCGKTNLLLLRAAYLQAKGRTNYQILTFGRVLKEFLVNGTDSTNVDTSRIKTYRSWAGEVLRECGISLSEDAGFEKIRGEILNGLRSLSELQVEDQQIDCILIDEVQDYTIDEINQILRFCDTIFVVGDEQQQIYRSNETIGELEKFCVGRSQLRFHYRNGRKICRVADGIRNLVDHRDGLEAASQYDERASPSEVLFHPAEDLASQVDRAIPVIADQLRAFPNGLVGVICPLRRDVAEVWSLLSRSYLGDQIQLQMYDSGYSAMDPDRRVLVGTVHGAKGLEFRALHLVAADGIGRFPSNKRRLAYTAVTRAKTSLAIYHKGALIGAFDKGLQALEIQPREVSLDDLFRH